MLYSAHHRRRCLFPARNLPVCILLLFLSTIVTLLYVSIYASPLELDHACFRKAHPRFHRGTVHLFLKNTSDVPVEVTEVYLDGVLLDDLPGDSATWMQTLPNPAPPGGIANLMIMLKKGRTNVLRYV